MVEFVFGQSVSRSIENRNFSVESESIRWEIFPIRTLTDFDRSRAKPTKLAVVFTLSTISINVMQLKVSPITLTFKVKNSKSPILGITTLYAFLYFHL